MAENKNRPASVVKDPVDAPLVTMQTPHEFSEPNRPPGIAESMMHAVFL